MQMEMLPKKNGKQELSLWVKLVVIKVNHEKIPPHFLSGILEEAKGYGKGIEKFLKNMKKEWTSTLFWLIRKQY